MEKYKIIFSITYAVAVAYILLLTEVAQDGHALSRVSQGAANYTPYNEWGLAQRLAMPDKDNISYAFDPKTNTRYLGSQYNTCYFAGYDMRIWEDAAYDCEYEDKGRLMWFNDVNEELKIQKFTDPNHEDHIDAVYAYWTSGTDMHEENNYIWNSTGETMTYFNWYYLNDDDSPPNFDTHDCLLWIYNIRKSGFIMERCRSSFAFLCKKQTCVCENHTCGILPNPYGRNDDPSQNNSGTFINCTIKITTRRRMIRKFAPRFNKPGEDRSFFRLK